MWRYAYSDELYHHGVKGMKWGRRRYQNKDGTLTPAGKKRYDTEPEGWSQRRMVERDNTYDQWRNAKGPEKKELKKKLQQMNKDGAKAFNELREFEGRKKYSKRDAKDAVESAYIAGPKFRDKYGDGGYAAVKVENMYDPNRRAKNAAKTIGTAAAGAAMIKLGSLAARSLYVNGKVDAGTARVINIGTSAVGSVLLGRAGGKLISDIRTDHYIKRYNKTIDKTRQEG